MALQVCHVSENGRMLKWQGDWDMPGARPANSRTFRPVNGGELTMMKRCSKSRHVFAKVYNFTLLKLLAE